MCALRRLELGVCAESVNSDRFVSLLGWLFTSVYMIQDTVSVGRVEKELINDMGGCGGGWPRLCAIERNSEERRGLVCMSAVFTFP